VPQAGDVHAAVIGHVDVVALAQRDFGFIARQRGMFSFFGIDTAQVHALRERHHIYMTDDSRMNIAGLRRENLEYFARAVANVLAG